MDVPRVDLGKRRARCVETLGLAHGPKVILDKGKFLKFPMLHDLDLMNLPHNA